MIKRGLDPISDKDTEILIVSTFPSEKALEAEEYYNNPMNQFWRLLGDVIKTDLINMQYIDRIKVILKHKIGLWNTISECERQTSSDAKIKCAKYNDFSTLDCPRLRLIAANSEKAYDLLKKCNMPGNVSRTVLISSSTARTTPYSTKLANWRKQLQT
jgi:double-stranded uracil-DNA glycosylase